MFLDKNTISSLEGIASYDCVFMELQRGKKMPTRPWDYFEQLHYRRGQSCIELAVHWLKQGSGVGYLLRNRLGGIDCDSMDTVRRVVQFSQQRGIQFPQTRTPSGGRHFLFEIPGDIEYKKLKHHVCHPKENGVIVPWDFKLGTRTMLVAPGTIRYDDAGNQIGRYKPSPWMQPPILDPGDLAPSLDIYRDMTPFVRDTHPLRDRKMGAMTYLRCSAPVSMGKGGRSAMREVSRHLVSWYDLDPHLALHFMTVSKGNGKYPSWNSRCVDASGKPYPWRESILLSTLYASVDGPSDYGIAEYKRQEEREFVRWCLPTFFSILNTLPKECAGSFITTASLYKFFLDTMGVKPEYMVDDEFGAEIHRAISGGEVRMLTPHRTSKTRGYKGADVAALYHAYELSEMRQQPCFLEAIDF